MPVLSPPFGGGKEENVQGEVGNIWVEKDFETFRWSPRKNLPGQEEDGLDKSPDFHSSSQAPRRTVPMLPDPSQDLLPFGGTFRHLAIQFLAQPPASPSSPSSS